MFGNGLTERSGMAYVAILFLIVILTTLGLAFVIKAGTEAAATLSRGDDMQAQYLAETAANHALWRILNEPGFPALSNVYYMHSLGSGRYGYKVKKPSAATFATVATVGAIGNSAVQQSYVPYVLAPIMTAYGVGGVSSPRCRRLVGATWDAAQNTALLPGFTLRWLIIKGCPTRKEMIMGALDDNNSLYVAAWNSNGWGLPVSFTLLAKKEFQSFDIAYESLSGRALLIHRSTSSSTSKYNLWNGSNWVHLLPLDGPDSAATWNGIKWVPSGGGQPINYVVMESNPASNEILVAILDDGNAITLWRWDGSQFPNFKYAIETNVSNKYTRALDIAYEQQSRRAMIVWARKDATSCRYRLWDGSTLSSEAMLPSFGKNAWLVRAVPDPTSNYIFVAAVDEDNDLNVAVWDGTAWSASRELETSTVTKEQICFDVAWENTGNRVLVAWGNGATNKAEVRYFTWTKGTPLPTGSVQTGPDFAADVKLVRLAPISKSSRMVLLVTNNVKDLRYSLWTGNRFAANPSISLETSMPYDTELPFDVAEMMN